MHSAHSSQEMSKTPAPGKAPPASQVGSRGAAAVFDRILDFMITLCLIFVAFMTLAICTDVGLRFFFNHSIEGLTEIATLLLVYMPFLAGGYVLRRERHITLDTVMTLIGEHRRALVTTITSICGIFISSILIYFGTATTLNLLSRGVMSEASIPLFKWIYTAAIPIGGLMLFIQFIRRTGRNWKAWKTSSQP
jgi:C4-dicarboxylate transporter DctQ subunit